MLKISKPTKSKMEKVNSTSQDGKGFAGTYFAFLLVTAASSTSKILVRDEASQPSGKVKIHGCGEKEVAVGEMRKFQGVSEVREERKGNDKKG